MNSRTSLIVSSVVLFHLAALWALHQGLLQRMVEVVVPVMAISQAEPPPPPPPPAKVELPTSKADYLHNPPPDYPRMSKRLGEQGRVVVKVLIGEDGRPQKVELFTSSGFERLDKSAMEAAMRWRYVPGKRGGVAEAMWYQVPIQFTLE